MLFLNLNAYAEALPKEVLANAITVNDILIKNHSEHYTLQTAWTPITTCLTYSEKRLRPLKKDVTISAGSLIIF